MKNYLMLVIVLVLLAAAPTVQANDLLDPIAIKLCFEVNTTYTLQTAQIVLFDAGIGKQVGRYRGRRHDREKVSVFGDAGGYFLCTNVHFKVDGVPDIYRCPVTRVANTLSRGQCKLRHH